MAYENLIHWYETKGYDFSSDSFLEEIKSMDDIESKKKTLRDYADSVSEKSKKPFSKGQREGLRKALDTDEIGGEFERNLSKREEQEQLRAEQYTVEVKRIEGLKQIAEAEEFETEYSDITETIEIQNAKKVKEMRKEEIQEKMAKARAEKEAELYSPRVIESGIERAAEQGESISTILKVNLPAWMLKEKGPEYEIYKEMANEAVERYK